jgi:hypothetical protein
MDVDEASKPSPGSIKVEPSSSTAASSLNAQISAAKLRKRTKTGCLTCRKRRIKCGEERPICTNCVRSKRQCEGYNQRIIFKTTMEGWPGMMGPANIIPHHTSMLPGVPRHEYHPEYAYLEQHTHYGIPIDSYGHPIPLAPQEMVSPGWPTPQFPLPQFSPLGSTMPPNNGSSSIPPTPTTMGVLHHPQGRNLAIAPMQSPGAMISPYYQQSPNFHQSFDPLSPQAHQHQHQHQPPTPHDLQHAPMDHTLPTPAPSTYNEAPGPFSSHGSHHSNGYFSSHNEHSMPNPEYTPISQTSPIHPDLQEAFEHKPGISRNFAGTFALLLICLSFLFKFMTFLFTKFH